MINKSLTIDVLERSKNLVHFKAMGSEKSHQLLSASHGVGLVEGPLFGCSQLCQGVAILLRVDVRDGFVDDGVVDAFHP